MRAFALILLVAGLAVLADQLMHRAMLERISLEADNDPGLAAAHILQIARPPDCLASDGGESAMAARALFTVESIATSRTEHALEWAAAWLSGALGGSPPDLSYGPGQIRPSTLMNMAAWDGLTPDEAQTFRETALRPLTLFDECRALALARTMIDQKAETSASADAMMRRDQLVRLAKDWNGQHRAKNPDAIMAGLRYQRLVYEVFQRLRFEALRQ